MLWERLCCLWCLDGFEDEYCLSIGENLLLGLLLGNSFVGGNTEFY